ncbi:STAS-like domain-containing protein [Dickeya zeae]|uniref:STAS-like domain-containing protein n=1 Tax=Dickeya zeae TaxID=204042 RepID=UPI0003A6A4AD|nr:STAS-like domain-containing protein [Dickeya zeae]
MKNKIINLIKDFNSKPYGRYPEDGEGCGENFRKFLVDQLKNNDTVHVELTGYNRYGRSFIDEAFGGLIRVDGYTLRELRKKLTYSHKDIKSIESLIDERLEKAESDADRG